MSEMSDVSEPRRYRKKPVVVEAMRYEAPSRIPPTQVGNIRELKDWGVTVEPDGFWDPPARADILVFNISHGDWNLTHPGDWIIKGTMGEFYPCEPAIFDETYELVVG